MKLQKSLLSSTHTAFNRYIKIDNFDFNLTQKYIELSVINLIIILKHI